jgi:hypothetical protein
MINALTDGNSWFIVYISAAERNNTTDRIATWIIALKYSPQLVSKPPPGGLTTGAVSVQF